MKMAEQGINIEGYTPIVQDEIFTQTSYIISDPKQPPGTEVIILSRLTMPSKAQVLENIVSNAREIIKYHTPLLVLPRKEGVWSEKKQSFTPAMVYMEHDNPVQGMLLETPYQLVERIAKNLANDELIKSCPAGEEAKEIISIEYGILPMDIAEKCAASDEPEKAYRAVMANHQLRRQGLGQIVNMQLKIKDGKLPEKELIMGDINNSKAPKFIKYALEKALNAVYAGSLDDIEDYSKEQLLGASFVTLQDARKEFITEQKQKQLELKQQELNKDKEE